MNTTHKAALRRLTAAKAVLEEATARQAVAAAAQAAANATAMLSGPPLGGSVQLHSPAADAQAAAVAAASNALTDSAVRFAASGSPTGTTSSSSSSGSSSNADSGKVGSASGTSIDQVEINLMSYVRRSPGSGLRLQLNNKPWLMTGFDVPHALQLAVQEDKRHQLLELMDEARGLGFNTMRVWAFGEGGMPGVGSAEQRAWHQEEQAEEAAAAEQQQQQGGTGQGAMPRLVMQPAPGILNATVMR
jgi:hypothetical protein